jgi:formylglycine-generating enzyme required for sulfatase activity
MARRTALLVLHSKSIDDATGRLPSPEADLPALAAALGDEAIGGFEVSQLIDDTVQAMREAIVRLFRSVGPQDVVLFYYAGNALQDQFGEVYLTARDTRPEALEATGLQVGFLRDLLDKSRCNQKVVILDCPVTSCFQGGRELLGSQSAILEALEGTGHGRFLICATDLIEAALEDGELTGAPSHSPLAGSLGLGLRSGEADLDGDGQVTVQELYDYVSRQIHDQGPSRPLPRQSGSPDLSEIVMGRNPGSGGAVLPSELEVAVRSPLDWMRQGALGELERLLTNQRRGQSQAARQLLSELTKDKAPDIARSATAILQAHPADSTTVPEVPIARPATEPVVAARERRRIPAWGWVGGGLLMLFAVGLGAGAIFNSRQSEPPPQSSSVPATPRPTAGATVAAPTSEPQAAAAAAESSLPSSVGMVAIPAGTYTIASNAGVDLGAYWIDQFEVTNAAFADFLTASGQEPPSYWAQAGVPGAMGDHPVRMVSWSQADAYCRWAGKRLPGEAEWEVAARGPDGLLYPWGDEDGAVTLPASDSYPVGSIPANRSVFGLYDMAGNVWEWVDQPYLNIREGQRILRGGANDFPNDMTYRLPGDPEASATISHAGFRCAAEQVSVQADPALVLTDEFANILSGWYQAAAPSQNYFYGYHPTDFYHVQVSAPEDCLVVRHDLDLADFIAEAVVFQAKTETETGDYRHGLMLRETASDFYAFTVSPRTKIWEFTKNSPAGTSVLAEGVEDSIRGLTRDEEDRLTVIANGAELTLFVNGRLVGRVYDDSYRDGNMGFFVETYDETYAHTHFDRVFVWRLPASATPVSEIPGSARSTGRVVGPPCSGSVSGDELLERFSTYTVKEGETLSLIADLYGLTIDELKGANGRRIQDPNLIVAGQVLIIPES